jgi:hypothetical protein
MQTAGVSLRFLEDDIGAGTMQRLHRVIRP